MRGAATQTQPVDLGRRLRLSVHPVVEKGPDLSAHERDQDRWQAKRQHGQIGGEALGARQGRGAVMLVAVYGTPLHHRFPSVG